MCDINHISAWDCLNNDRMSGHSVVIVYTDITDMQGNG